MGEDETLVSMYDFSGKESSHEQLKCLQRRQRCPISTDVSRKARSVCEEESATPSAHTRLEKQPSAEKQRGPKKGSRKVRNISGLEAPRAKVCRRFNGSPAIATPYWAPTPAPTATRYSCAHSRSTTLRIWCRQERTCHFRRSRVSKRSLSEPAVRESSWSCRA